MRYWLELPLAFGLFGRLFSDTLATGIVAKIMESDKYGEFDPDAVEFSGTKLQSEPLYFNSGVASWAYYVHAIVLAYWAWVFQGTLLDTLTVRGPVFAALGVPPVVVTAVAYANILVMYAYAGWYLATAVEGTIRGRAA